MKTVLLTGGTGYIGSHTAVELIDAGYKVVIVDNLSNSTVDSIDGIERITRVRPDFVKANCSNLSEMEDLFRKYDGFKSIIHFAALKAVGESVEKPLEYYSNNLVSLINLLQLMKNGGGGNIVFSSSCTVYGQPDILPVTETSPYKPATSPYGNTKKIAEDILRETINVNDSIRGIALRYFNPIGAHPSAEIGELPLGKPDNLVPFITQTAIGIREKLQIFGSDYDSQDGTALRDYFHVVDLAKAHVLALKRLEETRNKTGFEVFNVGAGKGITVLEIVKTFEKVSGVKLNYEIVGRRAGDIEKVWADTSLANTEMGWKVESTLEEALLSAWNWEKKIRQVKS
ncbi:MAG TPA: UDP-glucose 4-epimerase GalE [Bacteroidales bacterium]|nr:UDP-glucose 4-epimerase GalE [Bacteroidales bacterium]